MEEMDGLPLLRIVTSCLINANQRITAATGTRKTTEFTPPGSCGLWRFQNTKRR
jgi:hypothetical protein